MKEFILACQFLALEHIHSKEILHLDIKPSYIYFDKEGFAKISGIGNQIE